MHAPLPEQIAQAGHFGTKRCIAQLIAVFRAAFKYIGKLVAPPRDALRQQVIY